VARFEVPEGGSFGVNDEKPGKTPELADPNTEIAEYVLSIGGSVQLNLENRVYTKASELPKTSYQVSKIDLSNNNRIDAEKLIFRHWRIDQKPYSIVRQAKLPDILNKIINETSSNKIGQHPLKTGFNRVFGL